MVAVLSLQLDLSGRRIGFPSDWPRRFRSGLFALGPMLCAEFGFVLWVRRLTNREMHWGLEHSVGHYLDLSSAILGVTMFPIGFFFTELARSRR